MNKLVARVVVMDKMVAVTHMLRTYYAQEENRTAWQPLAIITAQGITRAEG